MADKISNEAQAFFDKHNIALSAHAVDLGETDVTNEDLVYLAELKNLKLVNLNNTKISDVAPLAKLGSLEILDLKNTSVSDVRPLAKLQRLYALDLSNTKVDEPIRKDFMGNMAKQLQDFYAKKALQAQGVVETPSSQLELGTTEIIVSGPGTQNLGS